MNPFASDNDVVFLFPSIREVAGIVVSEALSSGLFTLASRYSGIAPDFIKPGCNGYLIDPLDTRSMRDMLNQAIRFVREGRVDRNEIRRSIAQYTPSRYANAFLEALNAVVGGNDQY